MAPVATVARSDVERQKVFDRNWNDRQGALLARMAAVISAQRAAASGEVGAHAALRQCLVDLTAVSELLLEDLPAPKSRMPT
jgi:hypothetical protein